MIHIVTCFHLRPVDVSLTPANVSWTPNGISWTLMGTTRPVGRQRTHADSFFCVQPEIPLVGPN